VLPLKDDIPTRRFPVLTVGLIALNTAVWIFQLSKPDDGAVDGSSQAFVCEWGAIPGHVFGSVVPEPIGASTAVECVDLNTNPVLSLFTSQFLHGSWLHLLGNMLFLWVFGNNVEDRLGRVRFLPFYLVCGAVAALTQSVIDRSSDVPLIGASGAIAGVLGAYLLLYPRAQVWTLIVVVPVRIPAWMVLALWFAFQFVYAAGQAEGGDGVAYFAHVGGFVAGMLLIRPFCVGRRAPPPPPPAFGPLDYSRR
jgi:membrane associated rhomboid family serine protease